MILHHLGYVPLALPPVGGIVTLLVPPLVEGIAVPLLVKGVVVPPLVGDIGVLLTPPLVGVVVVRGPGLARLLMGLLASGGLAVVAVRLVLHPSVTDDNDPLVVVLRPVV